MHELMKREARAPASTSNSAMHGHTACLQTLIDAGADLNATATHKYEGLTPLMLAAGQGHADCVQALIDAGADLNAEFNGKTAVIGALVNGHTSIAELLVEAGAPLPDTLDEPAKSSGSTS